MFVDASNVPVDLHNLAIVARTTTDDYIAPGQSDRTEYDIPIPVDAPADATLRVRLRMRKTNQRWNDWLTNFDGTTVEVTDIYTETRQISLAPLRGVQGTVSKTALVGPSEPSPMGMVFVPAGKAVIGSEDGDADERPVREVYVPGYHIDRYPVTNAEYRTFLVATGRPGPVHRLEWAEPYNWNRQEFPAGSERRAAVLINHAEATAYCRWVGKRLPRR